MDQIEVSRTLVKSPPELWEELQGERLRQAVGDATVRPVQDGRRVEWEARGVRGAAVLEPAGWGTKVTLTAELEQEVAALESHVARAGVWARLLGKSPPVRPATHFPVHGAEIERALEQLLDDLGSAHRRPFGTGS